MKSNFEQEIRKSLEGFEYEYNPAAWNKLSSKLGNPSAPVKSPYKWYIAGGTAALAVVVCAVYLLLQDGSPEAPEVKTSQQVAHTVTPNGQNKTENPNENNTTIEFTDRDHTIINHPSVPTQSSDATPFVDKIKIEQQIINNPQQGDGDSRVNKLIPVNETEEIQPISPRIESVCIGQTTRIQNPNPVDLIIIYPNGTQWTGKANSNSKLLASQAGTYTVAYYTKEGTLHEIETFVVEPEQKIDFTFINSDEKFDERGLPVTHVKTDVISDSYTWSSNKTTLSGSQADFRFFKKGTHEITLTIIAENGCPQKITKSHVVEDDYNLLAVNSFDPTDVDPMNNTFMPYSLKVRGDKFEMIIIDPADGHIVYETNDASSGWDGIDKQNGNMVRFNVAYIWKVTLDRTEQGEQAVYSGTIAPIQRRK